jgi:hypothetical protein
LIIREEMKRSESDAKKFNNLIEWNRNEVDLADTIKVVNKKDKNNEALSKSNVKRSMMVSSYDRKSGLPKK